MAPDTGVASDVRALALRLQPGEQRAFVAAIDVDRDGGGAADDVRVQPSITVRAFDGALVAAVSFDDHAVEVPFVDVVSDEPIGIDVPPAAPFDAFSFALRCDDGPADGVDLDVRVVVAVSALGPVDVALGHLEPLPE